MMTALKPGRDRDLAQSTVCRDRRPRSGFAGRGEGARLSSATEADEWLYARVSIADVDRYCGWVRRSPWFRTAGGIVWAWFRNGVDQTAIDRHDGPEPQRHRR